MLHNMHNYFAKFADFNSEKNHFSKTVAIL